MYDIVYIGKEKTAAWYNLKRKYVMAKFAKSLSEARQKVFTKFFWVITDNVELEPNFDFDYQPDENSQSIMQIFSNGITLIPKNNVLTEDEFEQRFCQKFYDIVFISYNEPNADKNFKELKHRFPYAMRIHGIKGIHEAHIEAAKLVSTSMFWVVDGDAVIKDGFNFDYEAVPENQKTVHIWRSENPVNGLIYGYGGVKLLPTNATLKIDTGTIDMTTSISQKIKIIDKISNVTEFNTDPFSAWCSGFRECAKLASKNIARQNSEETEHRLDTWCNQGVNALYGVDTIRGAKKGREFGSKYSNNSEMLNKINDFEWLKEKFNNYNHV